MEPTFSMKKSEDGKSSLLTQNASRKSSLSGLVLFRNFISVAKQKTTGWPKNLLILFFVLITGITLASNNTIVINGRIDNCQNRNYSEIKMSWFNTKTLRQENQVTKFTIANDGSFYVKINNAPQAYNRYWIHLGNEYTHVDLQPGDSIYMTLDGNSFDESIKYSGIGAGRASYRRDVFLQFWDNNSASKINNIGNPKEFSNALNTNTKQRVELLEKYFSAGEIDSSYYQLQLDMIQYNHINTLIQRSRNQPKISAQTDSVLNNSQLNFKALALVENQYLQYDEYRALIVDFPNFILRRSAKNSELTIDKKINYAEKIYSDTTLLFFKSRMIDTCFDQAKNRSERVELHHYFNERFNEPVLKNRIKERGDFTRNTWRMNRFVQAMLIFCFWILVITGAILLILKVSTQSRHQSFRFNLSLWLKVAFYLIIAFIAFAFIAESHGNFKSLAIVILFLGTFLLHTYGLIPRLALRSKSWLYLGCLTALVFLNIGFVSLASYRIYPLHDMLQMATAVAGILILSWISYYVHQVAAKKTSFSELIKSQHLNLEIVFNVILVFLINLVFLAGTGSKYVTEEAFVFYTIILVFYLHVFISFPRFFNKEKILNFFGMIIIVALGASLAMIVNDAVQSHYALRNIGIESSLLKLLNYQSIRIEMLFVYTLLLVPAFVYYFTKKQFQNLENSGFKLYRKKEAELAQLRSQVNPHFLFNTLNTLYSFALSEGSDKTAECIAKLANLMRFMLDDMGKESIPLQNEISYIQDYVKLQSIRSAVEHDIRINIDIDSDKSYSIAPMLLIPFVENAFKHGMNPNKISKLKIDINGKDNQIQFVIENSVDDKFEAYYKEKGFGIGIENVKSRMEHIYPNRHTLTIAKTKDKFIVIGTINKL